MSGVRLSPGSPGVERVSRTPGSPRTPARRCLFGPVDHEQLAQELTRSQRAQEHEQRVRWNFDFLNHRPLEGPLDWEPAGSDTPDFYRRGPHPKAGTPQQHHRKEQHPSPEEEQDSRGRKRSGDSADSPNTKKSHRMEPEDSEDGDSSQTPEQTPRKNRAST
ncbi:cyclin-dependent kinase inhibitor 1B-like [Discoglossus pictus]